MLTASLGWGGRRAAAVLLLLLAVSGIGVAQRPMTFSAGLAAGLAAPVGDLERITQPGYDLAIMVSASAYSALLLRVEGGLRHFSGRNGAPDLRVMDFSGSVATELRRTGVLRIYPIAGGGVYRSTFDRPASPSENDLAAFVGMGMAMQRARIRSFSEARFHNIFSGANDSDESRRFVHSRWACFSVKSRSVAPRFNWW